MKKIPYTIDHLTKRTTFKNAFDKLGKGKFKLGQLKLLFTELFFLSKFAKDGDKVLYVGAAPGYHINYLIKLFPNLSWDLWDGRESEVDPKPNVNIIQRLFTDSDAYDYEKYEGRLLYICDIRNLQVAKYKKKNTVRFDELVDNDLTLQARWARIMKPAYSSLKFRVLYETPQFEYLDGTIYLQPYIQVSTETRLITNNYDNFKTYDCKKIDEQMAYFNLNTRYGGIKYKRWNNLMKKHKILNCWDNTISLHIIKKYLDMHKKFNSDEDVAQMFLDIVDFHRKKYGDKYDVLFIKKK